MGMAFIASGQYDKAAGRLEEVWEQDQTDPVVGEYLALAWLNTQNRRALPVLEKQAFELLDKLSKAGERITFAVQHSHEKMSWLQGRELNQYCSGKLNISKNKVTFTSEKGDPKSKHTFDFSANRLGVTENKGDHRGTFQLKTPEDRYFFATSNRNAGEAEYIVSLLRKLNKD